MFYPYTPKEVRQRKRTMASQIKILQTVFNHDPKPDAAKRTALAAQLNLTPRTVQVRLPAAS
jgi:hypothetical protein